MPFTPRAAAAIRDALLADWRARYVTVGEDLAIEDGTEAFRQADALSLALEPVEYLAGQAAGRVLIRGQSGDELSQTAEDDGAPRIPASPARRTARVTGTANTTSATNGATLSSVATATRPALTWTPVDPDSGAALTGIALNGSGQADVVVECGTPGPDGNVPLATLLTWSTAPVAFASTATVVAGDDAVEGEAAESDSDLQRRLIARRRERPGSGNRADWWDQAMTCLGVGDAFVHPCTQPYDADAIAPADELVPGRLGCTSVLVVNPMPAADSYVQNADGTLGDGLQPTYSRRPSQGLCDLVAAYIDGTQDAEGSPLAPAQQRQLYPAVIDRRNWGIVRPKPTVIDVTVDLSTGDNTDFAFDTTRTVTAADPDRLHVTLSSVTNIGEGTGLAFCYLAVDADGAPSVIQGAWATGVVASVSGSTVTLAAPLPAVPAIGAFVRADPRVAGNGPRLWRPVSVAAMKLIHALGVGAPTAYLTPGGLTLPIGRSARFPSTTEGAASALVPARVLAAVLNVSGVFDAAVIAPATTASATLALGRVAVVGNVTIRRKTI